MSYGKAVSTCSVSAVLATVKKATNMKAMHCCCIDSFWIYFAFDAGKSNLEQNRSLYYSHMGEICRITATIKCKRRKIP